MGISRRRFLALSATFTVGACSSSDREAISPPSSGPEPAASSTTTATSPPRVTDGPPRTTAPLVAAETSGSQTSGSATADDGPGPEANPFVFGVASGDPDTTSVVLWTRLSGEVAEIDVPDRDISVAWQFAADDGVEVGGSATTNAALGYSIHVVVATSVPGSFTFTLGEFTSPTGRTAPIDSSTTEFRIAAGSCQNFQTGHYAAHRDIAEWSPDLVVWLGDFIYEGDLISPDNPRRVREHEGGEPMDLAAYRARYATYLRDPLLQASRATAPWLTIWDDHEVENDYAGLVSQNEGEDPAAFAERRAHAYQAWWENTPTRLGPPSARTSIDEPYIINRSVDVGELVRISALDGRQFRSAPVSRVFLDPGPPAEGWDDPGRTMLGAEQERWITERFTTSTTVWNCLANQTVLSDTRLAANGAILDYDQWDGYHPARERLLGVAPPNLVTITGDIHLAMVGELGPTDAPVGIEFVNTAISSPPNVDPSLTDVFRAIPAVVDANLAGRGYTRHTVTPGAWTAEYRQVVDITAADSEVTTWKTFRVDAGTSAVVVT